MRNLSRFLWIPLAFYLITLMFLGYFNRPQSDDLGWFYAVGKLGGGGTLNWLWQTNGGRLFSNALIIGFTKTGWPLTHPWIIPSLSLTFLWLTNLYFVCSAKSLFQEKFTEKPDCLFYSLAFTLFPITIFPEPFTAIYWYTGVTVYLWPYMATLILLASGMQYIKHKHVVYLIIMAIMLVCTGSTNELTSIIVNTCSIFGLFQLKKKQFITGKPFIMLSGIALLAMVINLSAPGLWIRESSMQQNLFFLTLPAAWIVWLGISLWHILTVPLSWIFITELSTTSNFYPAKQVRYFLIAIPLLVLGIILFGTGGSLPLRTANIFNIFLFVGLALACQGIVPANWINFRSYRKLIIVIAFFSSPLTYKLLQTVVSAPTFSKAYDLQWEKINKLESNAIQVLSLEKITDSLTSQKPNRQLIKKLVRQKPELLWYGDSNNEETTLLYMLRLSGKDSIIWNGKTIINDHYHFPELSN